MPHSKKEKQHYVLSSLVCLMNKLNYQLVSKPKSSRILELTLNKLWNLNKF